MLSIEKSLFRQFTSGLVVCLSCLAVGMSLCWVSLVEQVLRSQESPVGPLSDSQISWLGSLSAVGAIFGALFWSKVINKIGRKNAAILTTVPMITAHLMYMFARSYYILLIPRFLSGIGMIGAMLNTPGYIAEICESKIKSNLASLFMAIVNLGTFMLFVAGFLFTYSDLNIVISIIPIFIAIIIFLLVPESPVHLIRVGQDEKAKELLKWLRASHDTSYINTEFEKLKENFMNAKECTKTLTFSEIWNSRYYLRSLLIGLVLQSSITMSGITVVGTYQHNIITNALNLNDTADRDQIGEYAMILSFPLFLGALLAFFIFHKFNRKVFLIGSNLTVTVCFFFVAITTYLRSEYGLYINPLVCLPALFMYMLVQGIGVCNAVYVMIPELFAAECRTTFASVLLFLHFSLSFILSKLYPVLVGTIHLYGWLFIFGSYSLWISIFGYFILPETRGKSIQSVFNKLSKDNILESRRAETQKNQISTIF